MKHSILCRGKYLLRRVGVYVILPAGLLLFSTLSYGQIVVRGFVIDERTKEAIIGATVSQTSTANGVATDTNGAFQLNIQGDLPTTLLVRSIGYRSQDVLVHDASEAIRILLNEDINLLDEVVVTGYVQQKRGVITASVFDVKSDEISDIQTASFDQKLEGKIPGVVVSSNSGTPGTSVALRIRGTTSINAGNSPLYVVDGVFVNSGAIQQIGNGGQVVNSLADLNPNDIEKIEVLKDANATSIYGSRGANGVILITTKRGTYNSKTNISFGARLGFSKVRKLWNMADGPEYATLTNEVYLNDGGDPANLPYPNPENEPSYIDQKLNDIFRTGLQQNYFVNFSGGDAKTTFYLGLDYNEQVGTNKPDDLKRYSVRINLDHKVSNKLKIGTSASLSRVDRKIALTGNNTAAPVPSAIYPPANVPARYEDGNYVVWGIHDSYLAMINDLDNRSSSNRLIGSLYGEYSIIDNLVFRTNWNIDYNTVDEDIYYPSVTANAVSVNGRATSAHTKRQTLINEQTLRYNTTLNNSHSLSFLIGNTIQKNNTSSRSISATGFPSDDFKEISSSALQTGTGSSSENGLISFFGRAAYDYDNKYIADLNVRTDGSSKFGTNNKWGTFPSVGLAWNLTEEEWFKAKWVNQLKLRTSYGITGNQNGIGNYTSYGLWSGGANYNDKSGLRSSQLANPGLKWETTSQFNIGIDSRFLNNRLDIEINYYDKYTRDLLVSSPIPAISGFSSITKNDGEISNRGIEFAVNSTQVENKNFTWTTSFNIAHNKNKIEKLENTIDEYSWIRMEQGQSMFSFYTYKQLYVDPQTGNAVIDDYNHDGQINADDRQYVGNALPTVNGGLSNTFKYKNFDLDLFLTYSVGNDVLYMFQYMLQHGGTRPAWGYTKEQLKRWQNPGDITDVPRLTTSGLNYALRTDRFMEDGSFLKVRSVTLGYNVPKKLLSRFNVTALRLFATSTNLFIFTNYSGTDPEINVAGNSENTLGIDFATAPTPRSFLFGVNLTL
ncbi:MAG: TonB-dependent receptor [Tannerellaceae bacterium]|jgi:TonB-linked SusC/RagA family outer membrane protein|nr:TonB-dependent receptor [Tannerellaceae bacterium]